MSGNGKKRCAARWQCAANIPSAGRKRGVDQLAVDFGAVRFSGGGIHNKNVLHSAELSPFSFVLSVSGRSVVHVHVALQPAIVELAFLDGLPAEVMLELRFGGDDVFFPAVGILEMPAERAVQPLRAALLEHPLAIGRVADEKALVRGQAHLRGVRLAELDELADARLARVLLRDLE